MSLYTGKRLHSYQWDELPIDDDVISRVEELAMKEDAPVMADGYPMFEWSPGVPIIDVTDINNTMEQISEQEVGGDNDTSEDVCAQPERDEYIEDIVRVDEEVVNGV